MVDRNDDSGQQTESQVPVIVTNNRQLREITADCLDALHKASPRDIYQRGGNLVTITTDDGQPNIEIITVPAMMGLLARCADFIRINDGGKTEAFPNIQVCINILSLGEWSFPKLVGITETPVIRSDGSILHYSGYDDTTRLYYYPGFLAISEIPEVPSGRDLRGAKSLVLEPFRDFCFTDDASRANALAIALTPVLRLLFRGSVPLPLFDKPQQGTGASLLADIISLISTGRSAPMISPPRNEDEWKKLIFSILIKGQNICVIDNLESVLQSEALSTTLTQTHYEGRILGKSEVQTLPSQTIWMATGNNIRLGGDLSRRSIWIRQDAEVAQPWLRDINSFKHPDLKQWLSEKRGDILGAILLIARAWVLAGKPEAPKPTILGGFESWSRTIGGILAFIGVSGFLGNLQSMYEEMDAEGPQWEGFLNEWYTVFGDRPVTTHEVITELDSNADLVACLPIRKNDKTDFNRTLGRALSKKQDVRYPNGLMLHKAGKDHKVVQWQVVEYLTSTANPPTLATEGGYGGLEIAEVACGNNMLDENNTFDKSNSNHNSNRVAFGVKDNPPNPPNPPDVVAEEQEEEEFDDEETEEGFTEIMNDLGLSEVDLLKDHEYILVDDKYSNLNVNIKIPPDAKWVGDCRQCMLTFVPPLSSSIEDLGNAWCPKCGSQEITWRVNKKALRNQTTLQKRIPNVFRKRILGWEN